MVAGEKDTTFDLISDFIIDANIIHEAMNQPIGADYDNDDAIFHELLQCWCGYYSMEISRKTP